MFPAAPVRFSTTTGCPHFRDSHSPIDARHHVGGAAGGERHDDLHRPRRIVLRVGLRQRREHGGKRKSGTDAAARRTAGASR